jgi:hypothetical protein
MPGGILAADLASIGFSGGITGRSMIPILRPPGAARAPGLPLAAWERLSS